MKKLADEHAFVDKYHKTKLTFRDSKVRISKCNFLLCIFANLQIFTVGEIRTRSL